MMIGQKLRELREEKRMSQGDIEKHTGLLRCYTSRVENGHTVPTLETIEKYAHVLGVPLYQLFYEGEEPPKAPNLPKMESGSTSLWGGSGKDARVLGQFRKFMKRMTDEDRKLLVFMAQKMGRPATRRARA
jgi:transcriptional regulator with XRE-family HTH domain